jgi:tetratricopeptide (TPR) repeat protein
VIIMLSLSAHAIIWAWEYMIYPMYVGKIKIAFSLEAANGDPIVSELKKEFCRQLDSLDLMGEVRVMDLPVDKKFDSSIDAEIYAKKKDINLLVWGHIKKGQLEGQEVVQPRLRFTYIYPKPYKKNIEELLWGDVKLAVVDRKWEIAVRNSIVDIDAVAKNLMEISLFIIGLCLLLRRDTKRCVGVFEGLHTRLPQGPFVRDRKRTAFLERFDQILIQALDLRGMYLYQSGKTQELKRCLERMIQINNAIPGAHINLAKLCYLEGNMDGARYHTNQADALEPNNPLCIINRAFFAILDRKYQKAVGYYNGLTKIKDWSLACNTLEVVLFLEDEWKKHKDNLGLLFGAGLMNYHFVDKRRGKSQLNKFIKKIDKQKVRKEYSPLFITAERTIKNRTR